MRDLFLYRTRHIKDPGRKAQAAIDLCKTMLKETVDGNSVHDVQLRFAADPNLWTVNQAS
jgi:hypothetical protein